MKIFKKAQGISFNAIVVGAIALIVLAVIVLIFMGQIKGWDSAVTDCKAKGGTCESGCEGTMIAVPNTDCDETDRICCVPFKKVQEEN